MAETDLLCFQQVPPSLLTGIICPIYKGKGKDPLSCHSYQGITITSILMKVFEYTILNRILPVLQEHGHPSLTQTAYQKHISCQDAIFAMQEAMQKTSEMVECPISLNKIWRRPSILLNTAYSSSHCSMPALMVKRGDSSKLATVTKQLW